MLGFTLLSKTKELEEYTKVRYYDLEKRINSQNDEIEKLKAELTELKEYLSVEITTKRRTFGTKKYTVLNKMSWRKKLCKKWGFCS